MADIVDLQSHYIGSPQTGLNLYQIPNASMQVLEDVINATWNLGLATKDEFSEKIVTSIADLGVDGVTAGAVSVPTISEPAVDIPSSQSASDVISIFDTKHAELVAMLSDKFTAFRAAYFPDESGAYTSAENWLQDAIANPDSGLPPAVQAQIFGEDQARILADATRASDAVLSQFASRRFPLPPDAAASAVAQIQQKAQDELADSSRKIAMLSVDMQRFSVEKMLALRQVAMDSAVKYIMAIASAPDTASKLVGVGYDAQSKLISSAASFYNARTQAAELVSKVNQYNNTTALEAAVKNQAADLATAETRLKALLTEAQAIAQMATAMFNNLHVSTSLTANGGTDVSTSSTF